MLNSRTKKYIRVLLDSALMRGPVNSKEVATDVYRQIGDKDEFWALADLRGAKEAYIRNEVVLQLKEPMSEEYLRLHLPEIPAKHLATFEKQPRTLCINAALGLHILAIHATTEQWGNNARMKRAVGESVIEKADVAEDIYRLLVAEGVGSIAELGTRLAA